MPATTHCANCMRPKQPSEYASYHCTDCETAKKEAREFATREGLDVGAAVKQAMAARVQGAMSERDPRMLFDRVDTTDISKRLGIVAGSPEDPNRATLR